jgi:hypothetical protein
MEVRREELSRFTLFASLMLIGARELLGRKGSYTVLDMCWTKAKLNT